MILTSLKSVMFWCYPYNTRSDGSKALLGKAKYSILIEFMIVFNLSMTYFGLLFLMPPRLLHITECLRAQEQIHTTQLPSGSKSLFTQIFYIKMILHSRRNRLVLSSSLKVIVVSPFLLRISTMGGNTRLLVPFSTRKETIMAFF